MLFFYSLSDAGGPAFSCVVVEVASGTSEKPLDLILGCLCNALPGRVVPQVVHSSVT